MTTLVVERMYGDSMSTEVIPVHMATDAEFDAFFCAQLREFCHRHGLSVHHFSDAHLLMKTRYTFTDTRSSR